MSDQIDGGTIRSPTGAGTRWSKKNRDKGGETSSGQPFFRIELKRNVAGRRNADTKSISGGRSVEPGTS
jgi:hypothetical protein